MSTSQPKTPKKNKEEPAAQSFFTVRLTAEAIQAAQGNRQWGSPVGVTRLSANFSLSANVYPVTIVLASNNFRNGPNAPLAQPSLWSNQFVYRLYAFNFHYGAQNGNDFGAEIDFEDYSRSGQGRLAFTPAMSGNGNELSIFDALHIPGETTLMTADNSSGSGTGVNRLDYAVQLRTGDLSANQLFFAPSRVGETLQHQLAWPNFTWVAPHTIAGFNLTSSVVHCEMIWVAYNLQEMPQLQSFDRFQIG